MERELDAAAEAIRDGELVVYPTETVYGLGGDALDPGAVQDVFAAKRRDRDRPLSLAASTVEAALAYVEADGTTRACLMTFLPGPVTVVAPRADVVPDVLTAGRDRVGVRVPDHPVATALLERVEPITATSANVSGTGGVREPDRLEASLLEAVAVVLDAGRTPGGVSTVVDPGRGVVHRRGRQADTVEAWLAGQGT